jgi:hypothetical protein
MSGEMAKFDKRKMFKMITFKRSEQMTALPTEAYTAEVVQPKLGYSPLLAKKFADKAYAYSDSLEIKSAMGDGALVGVVASAVALLPVLVFSMHLPVDAFYLAAGADIAIPPVLGAAAAPFINYRNARRGHDSYPLVLAAESKNLSQWLVARYGLTVNDEVLEDFAAMVHGWKGMTAYTFEDSVGNALKFEKDPDGRWYVREQADLAGTGRVAALQVSEEEPLLEGEAAMLHEQIERLLAMLNEAEGSAERQHLIGRARQDVASTLGLLRRLRPLGGADAQQVQRVVEIFSELVDELNVALTAEKASISAELDVQRDYVRQRKEVLGTLALPERTLQKSVEQETVHEG